LGRRGPDIEGSGANTVPDPAPTCIIATVGDHPVILGDARELRSLLTSAPSDDETRRLAVAITMAATLERSPQPDGHEDPEVSAGRSALPSPPLPSVAKRLAAYRRLLHRAGSNLGSAPVVPGACWAGHPVASTLPTGA